MNLHQEFKKLAFDISKMKNRLISLLLQIYEQEIYKDHGCSTIYEYAFKYARLSKERVQKALRTLRNTENTPMVRAKIATCGLDKVALVAKLATSENQHFFAEHVENMSTPALQAFTKELRNGKPQAPKMNIELDEEMQILFNQLKKKLAQNSSNQEALREILKLISKPTESVSKSISEDAPRPSKSVSKPVFEDVSSPSKSISEDASKPTESVSEDGILKIPHPTTSKKPHQSAKPSDAPLLTPPTITSRTLTPKKRQQLEAKTKGNCAYPHCTKAIEHFHHSTPFAFRQSHEKIVGLCKIHHELCHNGVIKNELKEPQNWQVTLTPHKSVYDSLYLKYRKTQ